MTGLLERLSTSLADRYTIDRVGVTQSAHLAYSDLTSGLASHTSRNTG